MSGRVTQNVTEVVSGADANLRITQSAAEVVAGAPATLRVSQVAAEVIFDVALLPPSITNIIVFSSGD